MNDTATTGRDYVNPAFPHFVHGGDYNPEQWKHMPEIWDEDMRLMQEAACNEMTVGIFAWAEIEPEEGVYDFSVLDATLDRVFANGGRVILATPSGARPRWLAEKYPEVLRVSPEGQRFRFGERHNHCLTSPVYREKVKNIDTILAKRYGRHPAVIAWHLSNEYGGECFCPLCAEAFRGFLRKKFHDDIDELNRAYWTAFWSHTYTDFSQIDPPSPLSDRSIHGLNLDWMRFVTAQTVSFMKEEADAVKAENPDLPVTTNMMFGYEGLNYWPFADVLDFASWDAYPEWHSGNQEKTAAEACFWHDFYRSLKKKPFFLMESTPSMVNWHPYNKPMKPGMDVLSPLLSVFHGSDSIQYFQFRKSRGSAEKLHGAVVGHDGTENTRVFKAVKETGELLRKIDEVCGTRVDADVAILFDWENLWALNDAQGYARDPEVKAYKDRCYTVYRLLRKQGVNVDIRHPHDDLSAYRLVVAPLLYLTDRETVENLCSYVSSGGTLLSGYFLGTVDENDLCWLGRTPADGLSDLFGIERNETDVLYPEERGCVRGSNGLPDSEVRDFAEQITLRGAEPQAFYAADWYAGTPALTKNASGKGSAWYLAFRSSDEFLSALLKRLLDDANVQRLLPKDAFEKDGLPDGVFASSRTDGHTSYLFLYQVEDHTSPELPLGRPMTDMKTGEPVSSVVLPPYGYAILKYDI